MPNSYTPLITDGGVIPGGALENPIEGAVYAVSNTIAYTDTVAKTLFTLPDGAVIIDWIINVTTAFNSSGTDLLDIGITGTVEKFAANVDVAATGLKTTGVVLAQVGAAQSGAQSVKGIYAQSVADADAGAAVIICRYFFP